MEALEQRPCPLSVSLECLWEFPEQVVGAGGESVHWQCVGQFAAKKRASVLRVLGALGVILGPFIPCWCDLGQVHDITSLKLLLHL